MVRLTIGFGLMGVVVCAAATEIFVERAQELGIDFHHFNGMVGEMYILEEMGPGCAWIDYDADGDLDLYIVQGHLLGNGKTMKDAVFPPKQSGPLNDRLFRNDLSRQPDGTVRIRFVDVTAQSGIDARGYGIGVTVGDFDNDGWPDIYVLNYGPNQLWRNNGDGTFREVAQKAGCDDPSFSVSASFVDYDRDGDLDLFVGNYIQFDFKIHKVCVSTAGVKDYCGPSSYEDARDKLYRNNGLGRFDDVSQATGIQAEFGSTLGVVTADFNGDGWIDIYVANDADPNLLWINQKDGTFLNDGILAGCAVNLNGAVEGSMGVDAADIDNDGDEDLFMTHLNGETNTLYVNDGTGFFDDVTLTAELGAVSMEKTGFGTGWIDYDNDGKLDIFVVNGAVHQLEHLLRAKDPYPLHQTNQLFRNMGKRRFKDVTKVAGAAFALSDVSRGAAFGDVDGDGDIDVAVSNNNGPVRLYLNQVGHDSDWIGLNIRLPSGRVAQGARVELQCGDGTTYTRRVREDGSYASANDGRCLIGLGASGSKVCRALVYWVEGEVESWDGLKIGRYSTLIKGQGSTPE